MIQEDIYNLLSAAPGVTSITTNIYPVSGPQETTFPVIVYTQTRDDRGQNFDEVENFVRATFMIDSYAESYASSITLAEEVKSALNDYRGGDIQLIKLESSTDILERETELFRVSQNYEVWHTEQ